MQTSDPHNREMKVLVVEDDATLAATIENMLRQKGLQVVRAADVPGAETQLGLQTFDLVLSDIRLPGKSGIELLHFIKRTKPMPVVLMTGFSEVGDAKEAHELGATGFLSKPFRKQELIDLVQQILFPEGLPEPDLDDQYSGLNIEEFATGNEIQFDIYVRLSIRKYVRIAGAGESIDASRVLKFHGKGLTHLYLRKDDFLRYLGFASHLAKKVVAAKNLEHNKKVAFLMQTAKLAVKSLYREKVDSHMFSLANELVTTTVEVLCEKPEGITLLESLRAQGDAAYAHSLAVSVYSTLVGKYLNWKSPRTLIRLSMAGLLHDVGKKEIDTAILDKPRIALSQEEVKILESHTLRGCNLLRDVPDIPEEVLQVVMQHHEDCKGLGYPMRLTRNHITPLARLMAVVEEFCELAFPGSEAQTPLLAPAAIARVRDSSQGRLEPEYLNALIAIFDGKKSVDESK